MQLTDFWTRMERQFGAGYASSVASDQVLAALDGRTVAQALEAGENPKDVWRGVCASFDVPPRER